MSILDPGAPITGGGVIIDPSAGVIPPESPNPGAATGPGYALIGDASLYSVTMNDNPVYSVTMNDGIA